MKEKLKALTILLRATKSVEKVVRGDIETYGLNPSEFGVLEILLHKGPQPMQNLCKKLLMANSSLTYVVDNLVKRGFAERYISEEDKRSNFVKLTENGEMFINEIFPIHEGRIGEIFSILSEDELKNLTESLKKIGYYSEKIPQER